MTHIKMGMVGSDAKLKAVKESNLPQGVDIRVPNFPATRNWAYRLAQDKKPAFVILAACLCANGACKLPDAIKVARKVDEQGLGKFDMSDDNILKSMFALGDIAYLDREKEDLVKEMMVSSDVHWWQQFIKPWCDPQLFGCIVSFAKEVGHTLIIE